MKTFVTYLRYLFLNKKFAQVTYFAVFHKFYQRFNLTLKTQLEPLSKLKEL